MIQPYYWAQQICSQGVAANMFWSLYLRFLCQRNSLTTTTTTQHTEGSVGIRWFQNNSLCVYYRTMWHANTTCHSLKIMLASKMKSNMLFVLELAAISSLFVFLFSYYSSSSRNFSLPTKGKQKGCEKKNYKSGSVRSQPHHLQNHCSRQLQNWRRRIYYSLFSTTNKTKKKSLERLFCWTNRENENWRACLLFKFKGSCSFQGTNPVNTLFLSDLKTHLRNSVFKFLIFRWGKWYLDTFLLFHLHNLSLYKLAKSTTQFLLFQNNSMGTYTMFSLHFSLQYLKQVFSCYFSLMWPT